VIAPGWISVDEMDLHMEYMNTLTGSFLEAGCAAGRLFSYVNQKFPNWKYTGINPWTGEDVYLQKDWDKSYWDEGNLSELITEEMFKKNCPFAISHDTYFEKFLTTEKFDIVSVGQVSKSINWKQTYNYANMLVKDSGFIIGRNYNHKTYGIAIQEAIKDFKVLKIVKQCFVLEPKR
jgi:hypothetical protein